MTKTEHVGRAAAPYLFLGQTTSLCETCLALVPAKIIAEGDDVFYLKRCRAHGVQKTLVADDLAYWKSQKDWLKPGDRPLRRRYRPLRPGQHVQRRGLHGAVCRVPPRA